MLYALPDHGKLPFGRLNLNCDSCLKEKRVQMVIHVVQTIESIFPYLNLERKSKACRTLRVVRTGCWSVQKNPSWSKSFSIQRKVRTGIHVVRTNDALVWWTSGQYDTSSGQLELVNRWASGRDDTSSGQLAGNQVFWLANSAESSETLLNSKIPVKKHLYI